MGACSGYGTYVSTDWKKGINEIIEDAEAMYGSQEGYSGAENSCNFYYEGSHLEFGKKTKKAEKDLSAFIESRLDRLGSGEGEVIKVGEEGAVICSTEIVEQHGIARFDRGYYLSKMKKEPALLLKIDIHVTGGVRVISGGKVSELKEEVHKLLRNEKYENEYYILTKNKLYLCSGKSVFKKQTKMKTNDKVLVLPQYKFVYYGWYRE